MAMEGVAGVADVAREDGGDVSGGDVVVVLLVVAMLMSC